MKFITFNMVDMAKIGEIAQASDKAANIPGQKILAKYSCLGKPFDGVPPNTAVIITVHESESAEALFAYGGTMMLAGATIWGVPVMDYPVGKSAEEIKKLQK